MPLINNSTYRAPIFHRQSHLGTLHSVLIRKLPKPAYDRVRLKTPDNDFIDLDGLYKGNNRAVILLTGLEGDSDGKYVRGMAQYFFKNNWDAVVMNFRGCSGEPNLLPQTYHVGNTDDLKLTIKYCQEVKGYEQVALIGFSMGGNIILKYLGEDHQSVPSVVKASATFSVPCHIPSSNVEMEKWYNWHYRKYLTKSLHEKYYTKVEAFPDRFEMPKKKWKPSFAIFDEHYTAPVNGFSSAMEYWTLNSSLQFLECIRVPSLLVNAENDTFLSEECYPRKLAEKHRFLHLETPKYGGHLGFGPPDKSGFIWSEKRALEFIMTLE